MGDNLMSILILYHNTIDSMVKKLLLISNYDEPQNLCFDYQQKIKKSLLYFVVNNKIFIQIIEMKTVYSNILFIRIYL